MKSELERFQNLPDTPVEKESAEGLAAKIAAEDGFRKMLWEKKRVEIGKGDFDKPKEFEFTDEDGKKEFFISIAFNLPRQENAKLARPIEVQVSPYSSAPVETMTWSEFAHDPRYIQQKTKILEQLGV